MSTTKENYNSKKINKSKGESEISEYTVDRSSGSGLQPIYVSFELCFKSTKLPRFLGGNSNMNVSAGPARLLMSCVLAAGTSSGIPLDSKTSSSFSNQRFMSSFSYPCYLLM